MGTCGHIDNVLMFGRSPGYSGNNGCRSIGDTSTSTIESYGG